MCMVTWSIWLLILAIICPTTHCEVATFPWLVARSFLLKATFDYDGRIQSKIAYDCSSNAVSGYDGALMLTAGERQNIPVGSCSFFGHFASFVAAKGVPKPTPNFKPPTNPPQMPLVEIPPGWRVREMPPTQQYPDGYWKLEKQMKDGSWQPIDPSTMKPGGRPETHVPFPPKQGN